ncbi:ferredoxin [Candidatus Woesearchaeota archaeon]|nr:ferredoxin [Candidatus Woesearchaeota archaeon]
MAKDEDVDLSDDKQFLLELDRLNCIGCGACVAVSPDFFELGDDGKVNILEGSERQDAWYEKKISKQDFKVNVEAAESCPVSVIHIKSLKDDKKII